MCTESYISVGVGLSVSVCEEVCVMCVLCVSCLLCVVCVLGVLHVCYVCIFCVLCVSLWECGCVGIHPEFQGQVQSLLLKWVLPRKGHECGA